MMRARLLMLGAILCPTLVRAQDTINPYNLTQHMNIVLQHTDVYYNPYDPPDTNNTREYLSSRGDIYRDPDGLGDISGLYSPQVYDTSTSGYVALRNWAPQGTAIGWLQSWMRLFQARDKPDGSHSDIVATDSVIVSALEDVDFRATGTVKLKNGFHARKGSFFHAYQEPKWDTTVFADEFDDTAKFRNQWVVLNGAGTGGLGTPQCLYDTNVGFIADTDALDGHALDLRFHVTTDTCDCYKEIVNGVNCETAHEVIKGDTSHNFSKTSSAYITSCPFPRKSANSIEWAYPHTPYGKYEIREKVPNLPHHTNFWGLGANLEWDVGETINDLMGARYPNWLHHLVYGPAHGYFKITPTDTVFLSYDDTAAVLGYEPKGGILYVALQEVNLGLEVYANYAQDTIRPRNHQFPASLVTSTDTFTFYYSTWPSMTSDVVHWTIFKAPSGEWVFRAPHNVYHGDSVFFRKEYQPVSIAIIDSMDAFGTRYQRERFCHWSASLNSPNGGLLVLDIDTNLHPIQLTENTESYGYTLADHFVNGQRGYGYPSPYYEVGPGKDNEPKGSDSVAFATQPFRYHTIAMEWLPHEVRFLYDSVVVRRFPDRLIPPGSPYFHWVEQEARFGVDIMPGEFDAPDVLSASGDTTQPWTSMAQAVYLQKYFLSHLDEPAYWDGAAHHVVDYVKVFDVPKAVSIPDIKQ